MKNLTIAISLLLIVLASSCQQKADRVIIKGIVAPGTVGTVKLLKKSGLTSTDSLDFAEIKNGVVILETTLSEPTMCVLSFRIEKSITAANGESRVLNMLSSYRLIAENQSDTLVFNLLRIQEGKSRCGDHKLNWKILEAPKQNEDYQRLSNECDAHRKSINKDASQKEKDVWMKKFMELNNSKTETLNKAVLISVESEKDALIKALLLENYMMIDQKAIELTNEVIAELIQSQGEKYHHISILRELNDFVKSKLKTEIGTQYIDFTAKNSKEENLSLSSVFQGNQYVLLEFWASWCSPCRKEIPTMKNDYKEFHDKGFEIFSISLDDNKTKWEKASGQEKIPWINTLMIKDSKVDAKKEYAVSGIPANFLIDTKTGKIVAKNLRGAALGEKLEELLHN